VGHDAGGRKALGRGCFQRGPLEPPLPAGRCFPLTEAHGLRCSPPNPHSEAHPAAGRPFGHGRLHASGAPADCREQFPAV